MDFFGQVDEFLVTGTLLCFLSLTSTYAFLLVWWRLLWLWETELEMVLWATAVTLHVVPVFLFSNVTNISLSGMLWQDRACFDREQITIFFAHRSTQTKRTILWIIGSWLKKLRVTVVSMKFLHLKSFTEKIEDCTIKIITLGSTHFPGDSGSKLTR